MSLLTHMTRDLHPDEQNAIAQAVSGVSGTDESSWVMVRQILEKISVKPGYDDIQASYSLHAYSLIDKRQLGLLPEAAAIAIWLLDFVTANFFKDGKFKQPPIWKYPKVVGFFFILIWKVYKLFK